MSKYKLTENLSKLTRYMSYVILVISIVSVICCTVEFFKDETIIKVNNDNEKYILECLNGEIQTTTGIHKVGFKRIWGKGVITVYYHIGKKQEVHIYEGMMKVGELRRIYTRKRI